MCGLAVSVGADVFKERIQLGGVFNEGGAGRAGAVTNIYYSMHFPSTSSIVAPLLLSSSREVSSGNLSAGSEIRTRSSGSLGISAISAILYHRGGRL